MSSSSTTPFSVEPPLTTAQPPFHLQTLQKVIDNAPLVLWSVDAQGLYTASSGRALKELGFAPGELVGRSHFEVHAHNPEAIAAVQRALAGETFTGVVSLEGRVYETHYAPQRNAAGTVTGVVGISTDITQRQLAEAGMQKQEQYFRELTDTVPTIIWITDPHGYCTYLNQHWYAYTGQTKEEAEGFGWLSATHPAHADEAEEVFLRANETKKPFTLLYRLRTASGDYRWCKDSGSPKWSKDGAFEGFIGTVADVHEEKLAAEKLRKTEDRRAHLLALSDAIRPLTEPHDIHYAAAAALGRHLGASRVGFAEDTGDGIHLRVTHNYTHDAAGIEGIYRYEDFGDDLLRTYRDGRSVVRPDVANNPFINPAEKAAHARLGTGALVDVPLLREGGLAGVLFVHFSQPHPFTPGEVRLIEESAERTWAAVEKAVAEKALKDSETKFRRLTQANIVGVMFWDLTGGIVDANDEFLRMLGYTRAELEKGLDWLAMTPPGWEAADADGMKQLQATGGHKPFEKQYLHKDGHPVDIIIASAAFEGSGLQKGVTYVLDISERKKAEARIRQNESRYRSIFEATDVSFWEEDFSAVKSAIDAVKASGVADIRSYIDAHPEFVERCLGLVKVTDVNEATLRMFEAESKAEMLGSLPKIFAPDTMPVFIGEMLAIADGMSTFSAECRFNTMKSNAVHTLFTMRLPRHGDSLERVMFSMLDISERKAAEDALKESEAKFRSVIQNAPIGICLFVSRSLVIESPNQAMVDIIGKGWGIVGKTLLEAMPELESEGQPYLQILDHVYTSGKPFSTPGSPVKIVQQGVMRERYYSFTYSPLLDAEGNVWAILDIATDVTDQIEAGRKIEESESRFRTLATSIPQIVWMNDAVGNLEYITQNWEAYTGQNFESAKTLAAEAIHPDDQPGVVAAWTEAFANGKDWKREYRLQGKEGGYRWFAASVAPLKDTAGNVLRWIGAATDIHEQKQSAEKLERIVEERTRELQRSNEDLQQFAHVASHDLKEPVRKIKMFSSRLEAHLQGSLDETGSHYLQKIEAATDRMYSMIDGVLTYSTLAAANQPPEAVDLKETLRNIETDLEVAMQSSGAVLDYTALPTVEGAPVLLFQLFYNLVNNSIKFAKAGVSPRITLASQSMQSSNGDEYAQIVYADNGIGFEADHAEKIFQTFTRLHPKDRYEGTGLGLSLCKKIAERHGGGITASSCPGEGTTFTILLPMKQERGSI